jgi:hypothetical protein
MTLNTQQTEKKTVVPVVKKATRLPIAEVLSMFQEAAKAKEVEKRGLVVADMAAAIQKQLKLSAPNERDIRLSIDRLRSQGHRIQRTVLKTFAYLGAPEPKKEAAK